MNRTSETSATERALQWGQRRPARVPAMAACTWWPVQEANTPEKGRIRAVVDGRPVALSLVWRTPEPCRTVARTRVGPWATAPGGGPAALPVARRRLRPAHRCAARGFRGVRGRVLTAAQAGALSISGVLLSVVGLPTGGRTLVRGPKPAPGRSEVPPPAALRPNPPTSRRRAHPPVVMVPRNSSCRSAARDGAPDLGSWPR